MRTKVLSEPEAIAAYVARPAPGVLKVGLETGSLSSWLHRGLCAAGLPALCIDARRLNASAKADPVKTDRKDARLIARAMRAGLYRVAHVKSEASLLVRQLLASRQMVCAELGAPPDALYSCTRLPKLGEGARPG